MKGWLDSFLYEAWGYARAILIMALYSVVFGILVLILLALIEAMFSGDTNGPPPYERWP